jgi:hypothetical protein
MKFLRLVKLYFVVLVILLHADKGSAQGFTGLNLSNNVITDVFTNPGYVVTNNDFQVNVAGFSAYVGNNAYYLSKNGINSLINGVSNPYIFKSVGTNAKVIYGNADFLGPAVSFKVKKKYYVAVTTRMRYLLNLDNLNDDAFRLMGGQPADTSKVYNLNNLSFNNQLFAQLGLSYGGIITSNDENSFRGGITLNYMMGFAAAALTVPHATFKAEQNNGISDFHGNVNVAFTPYANTWLSKGSPLSKFGTTPTGSGLGLDMGVVYEYTPTEGMNQQHEYLLRLSASITDIGSINYSSSSTTGSYSAKDSAYNINNVNKDPNKTYGQTINHLLNDSIVSQKGTTDKFKMHLPTALHLAMDLKLGKHFYLNLATLINLRTASADNYGSHYVTSFGFAPRYESKYFSLGVPFSVNTYKKGNLGVVIYAGPFYVGSTSILTPIINSNIDNFDIYMGIHFVFNKKKLY